MTPPPAPTNATRERLADLIRENVSTDSHVAGALEGVDDAADAILAALPDLIVDEAAVERACYEVHGQDWKDHSKATNDKIRVRMRAALRAGVGL